MKSIDITPALSFLKQNTKLLCLDINDQQMSQIGIFLKELALYNEHTNLVANANPELVAKEHVLDCLAVATLIKEIKLKHNSLVDIGSGAGFPGLVLAIVLPDSKITLVESISKKAHFLEKAVIALSLSERVHIVNERAETLAKQERESFDIATCRALGKIDLISELSLPLLKTGGYLLAQKSHTQLNEEEKLAACLPLVGGSLKTIWQANKEVLEKDHVIMVIAKKNKTPINFPRPISQIKRTPLFKLWQ